MSVSANLASDCSMIVLPVPKPPGTAAFPPSAIGKRKSNTRCPVMKGRSIVRRSAMGRGLRTGHACVRWSAVPSSSAPIGSSTENSPVSSERIVPATAGGTSTRCTSPPSCTVPSTSPPSTASPGAAAGVKVHRRVASSVRALVPGARKSPLDSARREIGRPMPSSTEPRSPGPSSTVSGRPASSIESPTQSPVVSS